MKTVKRALLFLLVFVLCAPSLGAKAATPGAEYLGRPLPDFTVDTVDGGTFTLSQALKEKQLVLINLWATWCGWCTYEFPALEEAYEQYRDRVEVIALSVEMTDTPEMIRDYVETNGLTFPVGSDTGVGLSSIFAGSGIPVTIVVDRFGSVAFIEVGALLADGAFSRLFDAFLGDDYTETRVLSAVPPAQPAAVAADPAELAAALGLGGGQITCDNDPDQTVWPMGVAEKDGRRAVTSTNAKRGDTASGLVLQVTANQGDVLAFAFAADTEAACDVLVIRVDGEAVKYFSGFHDWTDWAIPLPAGTHQVSFRYEKDPALDAGADAVWLAEPRLVTGEEGALLLASQPVYPTAEKISMRVLTEGAREIRFQDPDGFMNYYFDSNAYWLVPGGTAEVLLTVTADIDPELAFLYTDYDPAVLPLREYAVENGYLLTTEIDSLAATGSVCTTVFLYPTVAVDAREDLYYITLFSSEEDLNTLVDELSSVTSALAWEYAEEAAGGGYTVRFVDQNGDPVPGCVASFCSDAVCVPVTADENGEARFDGAPYAYHVQVLRAPEGYSFDPAQELVFPENGGEITLALVRE